ncbi:MAG TPA: FAD-dependent oxidoreductase [Pseudonocardiaceae bacterium]|jgi:pyruvate/2-oxoglutarate dehydrogenase complex dihydrolipoamide dehydrogenase (E3) component|nr:FAD-dependent oxidoreductase [Pseudonocardiaceae bacterium]
MASFDYDLAIIGAGSGGLTAARLGRFFAKRVALIDKDHLGGDCLNYGCVPSKALIKASRVAHEAATARRWGLSAQRDPTDLGAVNARVHQAITDIGKLDSAEVLSELGPDVLLGGATFRDPHTLRVGDRDITAKYILIASGSRPAVPDIDGLAEAGYLTNEDVFDLSKLPSRLAVIGGGPIGVELAQALHRLGSAVTIVQRGAHLIPRDDGDMIDILERQFVDEGIDVRINTHPTAVRRTGGDLLLTLGADPLRVDAILCAVGRVPNVEGLGLDAAGVTTNDRGIRVNDLLQTSQSHVYAVGDVAGGPAFTHYAGHQAAHAVRNIFVPIRAAFSPGHLPWVTFTDPEIAHVGRTEAQVRASGDTCEVIRFPYSHNERAVTEADTVGLMKFLIDGKRRLIGAHIAGHCAGEMINELTLAMNNDLTVDAIIGSIHAYPTYSFAIPIALYDYVLTHNPSAAAKVGRFLSRLT